MYESTTRVPRHNATGDKINDWAYSPILQVTISTLTKMLKHYVPSDICWRPILSTVVVSRQTGDVIKMHEDRIKNTVMTKVRGRNCLGLDHVFWAVVKVEISLANLWAVILKYKT